MSKKKMKQMSKKKKVNNVASVADANNQNGDCSFMIAGYTKNDEKIKFFTEDHEFPDGTAPCAIHYSEQWDTISFVFEDFTIGFFANNLIDEVGTISASLKRNLH